MAAQNGEIRYLTPPTVDVKKKKYCRFKSYAKFKAKRKNNSFYKTKTDITTKH